VAGPGDLDDPARASGGGSRAAPDRDVHGRGAAVQSSDDRGLPAQRVSHRGSFHARRHRDRVADLAFGGGARPLRGTRAARRRRRRAHVFGAGLGGDHRRFARSPLGRRPDPAQRTHIRVQRAGLRGQRARRRSAVAARIPLDRRRSSPGGAGHRGGTRPARRERRARMRRGRGTCPARDHGGLRRDRCRGSTAPAGARERMPSSRHPDRRTQLPGSDQHRPECPPKCDVRAECGDSGQGRVHVAERRAGDRDHRGRATRGRGPFVVRVGRQQGRHLGKRHAALLGAGSRHGARAAVPRIVRRATEVRPGRATVRAT
jgi:hypothetical protein